MCLWLWLWLFDYVWGEESMRENSVVKGLPATGGCWVVHKVVVDC